MEINGLVKTYPGTNLIEQDIGQSQLGKLGDLPRQVSYVIQTIYNRASKIKTYAYAAFETISISIFRLVDPMFNLNILEVGLSEQTSRVLLCLHK